MATANPSKSTLIWKEVVKILTNAMAAGQPLAYIKALYEGTRDSVPKLPVIILEPLNEKEQGYTVPQMKKITEQISILCYMKAYGPDTQIIGDGTNKGIKDIVEDVKNALNAFPNLEQAGNVTMIRFPDVTYAIDEKDWPNRAADITLEYDYLTQATTR